MENPASARRVELLVPPFNIAAFSLEPVAFRPCSGKDSCADDVGGNDVKSNFSFTLKITAVIR